MTLSSRWRGALPLVTVLSLALAACGSSASGRSAATTAPSASGPATGFPVTLSSAQGPVTLKARPTAIVSLSPTATETLFAIGAGHQVVAVDDQSNYPPEAPHTALSGLKPDVEAIAARKPDLVVIADDSSGVSAQLSKIDIPVLVDPPAKDLNDAYAQIAQLGSATGHTGAAAGLVSSMRSSIAQATSSAPHRTPPLRIYHELDDTLYSATSSTFIGQLYRLLGATNIADAADTTGSGYPQLSAEYVVKADPDVIFLADTKCCHQNLATVAARPAWAGITAVKDRAVVNLDDDIASRWGPRVVDLVRLIANGLHQAPAAGGSG